MPSPSPWLSPLASFAIAAVVTGLLVRWLARWKMVDRPNERSSHTRPTPRGGGIGVLAGLAAGMGVAAAQGGVLPPARLLLATLLVAAVGFWDDRTGHVPWRFRLAVHALAALWVVLPVGGPRRLPLPAPLDVPLGPVAVFVGVLWIVAVLNFVNFMDGIDGISGLQVAITGLALGAALGGPWSWLGPSLAAAAAGFLLFNWHPARIFLGDVGSGALGFLLAAAPFTGARHQVRTGILLVGLSLFLFLGDALVTLLLRARRGERLSEAHRRHLYQRLVRTGMGHRAVASAVAGGGAVLSVLAVGAYLGTSEGRWILTTAAAVTLLGAQILWVRWREEHRPPARSW